MNADVRLVARREYSPDEVLAERKALIAEIKRRLGVRSVEEAATALGISRFVLDAITRPERSIPPHVIATLREAIPGLVLPNAVAQAQPDGDSIGLWHNNLQAEVFRAIRSSPVTSDFDHQVRSLFTQLEAGDHYVLFSYDQKPFEMASPRFFDSVVKPALGRGAKFIYVLPKKGESQVDLRTLNILPDGLADIIEVNRKAIKKENDRDNLIVCRAATKDCPFLIPGIKFAFVLSTKLQVEARSNCVASVSIPIGDNDSIHIPLADSFAEFACGYFAGRQSDNDCKPLSEAFEITRNAGDDQV